MSEFAIGELLVWLITVAVYVAIPVTAFLLLRRFLRARRSDR